MKQLEDANIKDQEESIMERELALQQQQQREKKSIDNSIHNSIRLFARTKESSYSLNYTKTGATITYRL